MKPFQTPTAIRMRAPITVGWKANVGLALFIAAIYFGFGFLAMLGI